MILYVDETESENFFLITGLLVKNKQDIYLAYKHFKNRIKYYPLSMREKEKVYIEFKSFLLDNHYQKIKRVMLEEIVKIDNLKIMYSIKIKKNSNFKQSNKEKAYLELISKIAQKCGNVSVVFDSFNNPRFEAKIIEKLCELDNVIDVKPKNSQDEPGIKFVDNLCGTIRLHIMKRDYNNFYKYISFNVVEI